MDIFIAGVSGETQYTLAMTELSKLITRPGDDILVGSRDRGEVARTGMADQFLANTKYGAILMLDLDMQHPEDLLERLRAHDLDMVTGHYFRRQGWPDPMYSIVSNISRDNSWPYPVMMDVPTEGLHEISNAGQGCVLIKREVVEAVRDTLPAGDSVFATRPMPLHSGGYHQKWGSDYAFFTMARDLGYKLWLDASLESKHGCVVWLDRELYGKVFPTQNNDKYYQQNWDTNRRLYEMNEKAVLARKEQLTAEVNDIVRAGADLLKVIEDAKAQRDDLLEQYKARRARIDEIVSWIGGDDDDKQTPEDLPKEGSPEAVEKAKEDRTTSGREGWDEEKVLKQREKVYNRESMSHIETLDRRPEEPESEREEDAPSEST